MIAELYLIKKQIKEETSASRIIQRRNVKKRKQVKFKNKKSTEYILIH